MATPAVASPLPNSTIVAARKPHSCIFPLPAQGHVAPLLQLAHHLASLGFFVTFITPVEIHSRLVAARSDHDRNGTGNSYPGIQLLPIPDDILANRQIGEDYRRDIGLTGTDVELLIDKLKKEEPPLTCLISDNVMPWVQDVADRLGIPRVVFWPFSASVASIQYYMPLLATKGYIPYTGDRDSEDKITCIPGLAPVLRAADFPDWVLLRDTSEFFHQLFFRTSAAMKAAERVLVHSIYELERNVIDGLPHDLPIYTVGPLLPLDLNNVRSSPFDEDEACLQWLNTRDPSSVLYISFGTTGVWSAAELKELALGLEASEQPFIWVSRPSLEAGGSTFSISDIFSAQTKQRSMIISWAPQLSVLQHPSVGGFLTHCGWNSVIESMHFGVPMIGWPKLADQMTNRRLMCEEWKIAIPLETPNDGTLVTRGEVEKAVRALLKGEEGKEARRRAAELRKLTRMAVGGGGSSKTNLEGFVKDMTKRANEATENQPVSDSL